MSDRTNDDEAQGGPSQAEGDRETVEESLGERPTTHATDDSGQTNVGEDKPSQAEGDRESAEQ